MAFTDGRIRTRPRLRETAAAIASAGPAVALVARDHQATAAELTQLATLFIAEARPREAAVFVAGRPDLAAALGVTGVQLRARDLAPHDARRLIPHAWIGRSVHSTLEAVTAVEEGADFLVAGPVYETTSHPGAAALGLRFIETLVPLDRPIIAIGGITPARAREARAAGAWGVAAITALWSARHPARAALEMLEGWL
jgi:thiamine-phosphate diphosphorylase